MYRRLCGLPTRWTLQPPSSHIHAWALIFDTSSAILTGTQRNRRGCILGDLEQELERVEGEVRAACHHLGDACPTRLALTHRPNRLALALALLPLGVSTLSVECDDAGEEAVTAFYAALEHPTCTVRSLTTSGAAFGTRAAAAHLGRCLNVNSTIHDLTIDIAQGDVDGFCGEAVWTAFSDALTSNATLQQLKLIYGTYAMGNGRHVGATLAESHKLSALRRVSVDVLHRATVVDTDDCSSTHLATMEEMVGWGTMLTHNSTITILHLEGFLLPRGGRLLGPLCDALVINTTVQVLVIMCVEKVEGRYLEKGASTADDAADAHKLAEMLSTNRSLKLLDIIGSGMVCNAVCFDQGLSQNSTLEELAISVDAAGAQALMTALSTDDGGTSNLGRLCLGEPSRFSQSGDTYYKTEDRYHPVSQHLQTARALGDMLASNRTLTQLFLAHALTPNKIGP